MERVLSPSSCPNSRGRLRVRIALLYTAWPMGTTWVLSTVHGVVRHDGATHTSNSINPAVPRFPRTLCARSQPPQIAWLTGPRIPLVSPTKRHQPLARKPGKGKRSLRGVMVMGARYHGWWQEWQAAGGASDGDRAGPATRSASLPTTVTGGNPNASGAPPGPQRPRRHQGTKSTVSTFAQDRCLSTQARETAFAACLTLGGDYAQENDGKRQSGIVGAGPLHVGRSE